MVHSDPPEERSWEPDSFQHMYLNIPPKSIEYPVRGACTPECTANFTGPDIDFTGHDFSRSRDHSSTNRGAGHSDAWCCVVLDGCVVPNGTTTSPGPDVTWWHIIVEVPVLLASVVGGVYWFRMKNSISAQSNLDTDYQELR